MDCEHNIVILDLAVRNRLLISKGEERVEQLTRREMLRAGMDLTRVVEVEIDEKRNQFIIRQATDPKNDPELPRLADMPGVRRIARKEKNAKKNGNNSSLGI